MVVDDDQLQLIIDSWDITNEAFRKGVGDESVALIKDDIFNGQGQATVNTDPLNPGGMNEKWQDLSPITQMLKKSSSILINTGQLRNTVKYQIEDSSFDDKTNMVKVGWFEDAGGAGSEGGKNELPIAHIAAIHEFGLTGKLFLTPEGVTMGGDPIGRTSIARRNVRNWYWKKLGLRVSGVVVIPERSMLRKCADLLLPKLVKGWLGAIFFNLLELLEGDV